MAFEFTSLDSLQNMTSPLKSAEVLSLSDRRLGNKVAKKSEDENDFRTSFNYDDTFFEKKVLDKNNKEIKKLASVTKNKKKSATKEPDDEFSKKMQEMFKEDALRTQKFHIQWEKFLVDFSKNKIIQ